MCHRSRIWRRYGGERAGLGRYGRIGVDRGRKGIDCVHFDGLWWYEWVGYDVLCGAVGLRLIRDVLRMSNAAWQFSAAGRKVTRNYSHQLSASQTQLGLRAIPFFPVLVEKAFGCVMRAGLCSAGVAVSACKAHSYLIVRGLVQLSKPC